MNWLILLGQWWESRRAVRTTELKSAVDSWDFRFQTSKENMADWVKNVSSRMVGNREETDARINAVISNFDVRIQALKDSQNIPATLAKEVSLLKARLDRLELLTGLKREPEAIHVKDMPRIG